MSERIADHIFAVIAAARSQTDVYAKNPPFDGDHIEFLGGFFDHIFDYLLRFLLHCWLALGGFKVVIANCDYVLYAM